MLMFSYGMNTNAGHMAQLCPSARSLGLAILLNHRLVFKQHCDVEPHQGAQCEGVLWEIDEADLEIFDRFEHCPLYYNRKIVEVWQGAKRVSAVAYYMSPGYNYKLPADDYFQTVRNGYIEHGIDTIQLIYAVANTRHILSDRANKTLISQ